MQQQDKTPDKQAPQNEAYKKALELLYTCSTEHGFLASSTDNLNYRRIWARDGVIIGLAGLLTGEPAFSKTLRATLEILAENQGPHGEIPSNVDPVSKRVSYGGTTGRVDANMWFVIGCGEYWRATGDDEFIEKMHSVLEKVRFLLGAWEYNNRGLLYIPQAGDWADEYIHHGYVLYDQLLYLQCRRTFRSIHHHIHDTEDHTIIERIAHLKHLITDNYWFSNSNRIPDDVYHEVLYEKGYETACHCHDLYWLPYFSPSGYGYRFDTFANILASLFNVANEHQQQTVDKYISTITNKKLPLLPAFHPVIEPLSEDWEELQITFSYTFKNKPYEYHNGGLWSMLTGFYVADLARRGQITAAKNYLSAINKANAMPMNDAPWSFAEYIHGKTLQPGGNTYLCWSAAATIIGEQTIAGNTLFRIDDA
ncbi:MAG: glycoside hydrolase 100 family protein [Gammaproteobacteria bacterium]